VKPENIHLTLRFLGNIDESSQGEVIDSIESVFDKFSPLNMNFSGLGVFPDERRPRVLWTGLEGDVSRLSLLASEICTALRIKGFPKGRNHFSPHITIGRFKKKDVEKNLFDILGKYNSLLTGFFVIDEIVFYKSELLKEGAKYSPLFSKTLKK
jgi:2'-5' RNA ligase